MIHALPGLGGDHRLFPGPWNDLPDFIAHDWPPHHQERTLAEVAHRLCDEFNICDGDILVGASLGGMVACEVAKIRQLKVLYLVGSAAHKEEISHLLALLHPLIDFTPIDWLRVSAGLFPGELPQMFAGSEPSFLRSMCRAIFQWEGMSSLPTSCYRIHGRHDRVIPPPLNIDLILDGGHLISMSHPKECVDFLRSTLARNENNPPSVSPLTHYE
jgi:pimeloyl-ACP methyl ester carboxylesterase